MKQIRHSVFETNSSSTHSLTICTKGEYAKWKKGELVLEGEDLREPKDDELDADGKLVDEDDVYTYERYGDIDQEQFEQSYTTPNGEELVAFGCYGYDG